MNWVPEQCRYGDIIRVGIGSIYHYGIYVSDSEVIQFGLPPVNGLMRNDADIRVLTTDIDEFAGRGFVEIGVCDRREKKKRYSPEETVERARRRIGEGGYSLLHNNCEHFVWECAMGQSVCTAEYEARKRWEAVFSGNSRHDRIPVARDPNTHNGGEKK